MIIKEKSTETFKVRDLHTNEIQDWAMKDVLEEINRDRSDTWSEYNETDWKEGWEHWVEGDGYYTMVDPALTCTYPFASDDEF